jgi:hypothetical protein
VRPSVWTKGPSLAQRRTSLLYIAHLREMAGRSAPTLPPLNNHTPTPHPNPLAPASPPHPRVPLTRLVRPYHTINVPPRLPCPPHARHSLVLQHIMEGAAAVETAAAANGKACCHAAKGPGYATPLEAMEKGPREKLVYVTCVYNGACFLCLTMPVGL